MPVKLARRCWGAVLMFLAVASMHLTVFAESSRDKSGLGKSVARLYGRSAWVAVFATQGPVDAVPLALASRRELNEIFAPDLAQAIWDDAQCAEKRGEICTIDYDILFDSQDPSASDLTVEADARDTNARACFNEASGARTCLSFVGECVKGMAKVADIVYPGQRSLRQLLGLAKNRRPTGCNAATRR